jgi:hypothetical protein
MHSIAYINVVLDELIKLNYIKAKIIFQEIIDVIFMINLLTIKFIKTVINNMNV